MPLYHKNQLLGIFWAALTIVIASSSFIFLRLGVTTSLNAYDLSALRFGTAAILLIPVIIKRGFSFNRVGIFPILLMIICFGAPYIIVLSLALTSVPASAAGALNPGVMVLSSLLFSVFIFKDKLGLVCRLGAAFIFVSLFLCIMGRGNNVSQGHFLLILSGSMWAIYTFILYKARIPALQASAILAVGSAPLYLPIYYIALPKQISAAPLLDILIQMGFQGIFMSVIMVFSFNRSTELLGPRVGATLPALIPLITLGMGWIVLSEPARIGDIAIATLIGLGVTFILIGRNHSQDQLSKTVA